MTDISLTDPDGFLHRMTREVLEKLETLAAFENPTKELESVCEELPKVFCKWLGHAPEADQCGRPEHDFCIRCNASTPNRAKRDANRKCV